MVSERTIETRFRRLRDSMFNAGYDDIDTWREEWRLLLRRTLGSVPEGEDGLALLKAESVAAIVVGLCVAVAAPTLFDAARAPASHDYAAMFFELPPTLGPLERRILTVIGYYHMKRGWTDLKPCQNGSQTPPTT